MSGPSAPSPSAPERPEVLRRYSPWRAALFGRWLDRYLGRSFDGVRVSRAGPPPADRPGPLLVVTNHPSWWDPLHFLILGRHLFAGRRVFGPFAADALAKYRLFTRLGGFPVEPSTRRGAAEFLATGLAVLATPGASLWITAQGEFADPRRRPLGLRPGAAHLIRRLRSGMVVPLAVEYPFWSERLPEALSRFGRPIELDGRPARSVEEWTSLLGDRLIETMDGLAEDAASRDPGRFETLVLGRAGVGGVYDRWRALRARLTGRRFEPAHDEVRR